MPGAQLQLVSYGAQDMYLTGNPQITFFKVVYRRHTNFAMEHVEQIIHGTPQWGTTLNSVISRTGDLLYRLNIEWTPKNLDKATDSKGADNKKKYIIPHNFGHYMFDYISLSIGGQEIDKLHGHWMEVYSRLTQQNPSKTLGNYSKDMVNKLNTFPINSNYNNISSSFVDDDIPYSESHILPPKMTTGINSDDLKCDEISQNTNYQQMAGASGCCGKLVVGRENVPKMLQIPLPFWFCRNPGLALPIIALQYHDVKLTIKMKENIQSNMYITTDGNATITDNIVDHITPTSPERVYSQVDNTFSDDLFGNDSIKLWAEYIYLDTEERRRFAQVSHEYLIEQVQRDEKILINTPKDHQMNLNKFNHPVKALIFTADWGENTDISNMFPDNRNSVPYSIPWWEPNYHSLSEQNNRIGLRLDEDVLMADTDGTPKVKEPNNIGSATGIFQRYSIPGWLPGIGDSNTKLSLSFNGHDRFNSNKPWYYFSRYQTTNHFSGPCNLYCYNTATIGGEGQFQNGGRSNSLDSDDPLNQINDSIGVYSFALKPEEHQPSGTCNFSRLDNCKLTITDHKLNPNSDDLSEVKKNYDTSSTSENLVMRSIGGKMKYINKAQTYFNKGDISIDMSPDEWLSSVIQKSSTMEKGNTTWPAFRYHLYGQKANGDDDEDVKSFPVDTGGYSNLPNRSTFIVYAINYNVLRIMSGMAGLAYSN